MAPRPAAAVGRGPKLVLWLVVVVPVVTVAAAPVPVGAAVVSVPEVVPEVAPEVAPDEVLLLPAPLVAEGFAQVTAVGTFTPTPLQSCF